MKFTPKQLLGIKILVHLGALLFFLWLFIAIPKGLLGGDPVPELIHYLGKGALNLLLLTLCITPLSRLLKAGQLLRLRRPLGLWCFAWASCHFTAWISFDLGFAWQFIGEEIFKRTYILIGVTAWLILLALAITSIPTLLRKMGKRWKQLHNSIYAVSLLVVAHYWWSLKSGWIEPAIYLAVVLFLLWWRRNQLFRIFSRLYSTRSKDPSAGK